MGPPTTRAGSSRSSLPRRPDLAGGGLPADLRLVIEGEEETGSAHLEEWALEHAGELRGADGVFCLDGATEASTRLPRVDLCFAESLGIPPVLTGFANPDCRIHSPDENLDLGHYIKGIEYAAAVLFRLVEA